MSSKDGPAGRCPGRPARSAVVVEDDTTTRQLLVDMLRAEGYAVQTDSSGLGVHALVRDAQPSVVLLDLGLPFRSGAVILPALKSDPATSDIPVVIVSGLTELLTPALRAMAAAIVEKPFDIDALMRVLRAVSDAAAR